MDKIIPRHVQKMFSIANVQSELVISPFRKIITIRIMNNEILIENLFYYFTKEI